MRNCHRYKPSRASASVNGLATFEVYGSISWHKVSNPTCAVVSAGQLIVSVGSTIATDGIMLSCRIDALRPCSKDFKTAFLVASAPVPLVVGIAISGRALSFSGNPFPMTSI